MNSLTKPYPTDCRKNKEYRLNMLQKADDDAELRAILIEKCKRDIIFWFDLFAYTYDPRLVGDKYIPFLPYEFQENDLILPLYDRILNAEHGETMGVEKARDMGVTWCVLAVFFYCWLFHDNFDFLIGSRKEEYVDKKKLPDTLFGKLDILRRRTPKWMLPRGFDNGKHNTHMVLANPANGSMIRGESSNSDFSRSGRYRACLMDELAFWDNARSAYSAASESCNLLIPVSTLNPEGSGYFKVLVDDEKYEFIRLEHTLHPNKGGEWLQEQQKKKSSEIIAVEILLDYTGAISGKVYQNAMNCPVDESYDYDPNFELYRSWDFGHGGTDPTAILWLQKDLKSGTIRLIDWYQLAHDDINYFAPIALGSKQIVSGFVYTEQVHEDMRRRALWRAGKDIGDPYSARQKTGNTHIGCTLEQELQKHGINLILKTDTNVSERIEKGRQAMKRLVVHPRALPALELIAQARFPTRGETSQAVTPSNKPVHDYTSHVRTAWEYYVDNEPQMAKAREPKIRTVVNPITGKAKKVRVMR